MTKKKREKTVYTKVRENNPLTKFKKRNKITWYEIAKRTDLTPQAIYLLAKKDKKALLNHTTVRTYIKLKEIGLDLLTYK